MPWIDVDSFKIYIDMRSTNRATLVYFVFASGINHVTSTPPSLLHFSFYENTPCQHNNCIMINLDWSSILIWPTS